MNTALTILAIIALAATIAALEVWSRPPMRHNPYASAAEPRAAEKPEPNAALREIAGRVKKLPFRDMQALAATLADRLPGATSLDANEVAEAILTTADMLETA